MKKRVFIVHGWGGHPEEGWFTWLKKEMELKGFEVYVPQLPETENPIIRNWVPALAKAVGIVNENTYFIGHSMGCQTIVRYLETLPEEVRVGGAIFVAGFFKSLTLGTGEEKEVAKEWLETPINFEKVKSHLPKSVAIFSDDDPWVPLENQDEYKNKLESEIIIENNMGHFSESNGVKEIPILLEKLLNF